MTDLGMREKCGRCVFHESEPRCEFCGWPRPAAPAKRAFSIDLVVRDYIPADEVRIVDPATGRVKAVFKNVGEPDDR